MRKWIVKQLKRFGIWVLEIGPKHLGEKWTEEDRRMFEELKKL